MSKGTNQQLVLPYNWSSTNQHQIRKLRQPISYKWLQSIWLIPKNKSKSAGHLHTCLENDEISLCKSAPWVPCLAWPKSIVDEEKIEEMLNNTKPVSYISTPVTCLDLVSFPQMQKKKNPEVILHITWSKQVWLKDSIAMFLLQFVCCTFSLLFSLAIFGLRLCLAYSPLPFQRCSFPIALSPFLLHQCSFCIDYFSFTSALSSALFLACSSCFLLHLPSSCAYLSWMLGCRVTRLRHETTFVSAKGFPDIDQI